MSDVAIRVDHLSKRYYIGALQKRHDTLRDAISDFRLRISDSTRRRNPQSTMGDRQSADAIWALRDVSFEVKRGEVVGIIGRNGAGKSTLLKILSRITEPTEGRAEIHGRVGSLLEVGTGFHPELTGRENIYLNGAILGMRRVEIDRRFDEIVAFAEIDQFLDTPVKRYSSGMYVRLAFAVAAHLEPEILLVDEVLAVGDVQFQEKCLGRMSGVAKEGRTILFVSHNLRAIERLCPRSILMVSGEAAAQGASAEITPLYRQLSHAEISSPRDDNSGEPLRVELTVRDGTGQMTNSWPVGNQVSMEICVPALFVAPHLAVDVTFYTADRTRIFYIQSDATFQGRPLQAGTRATYRLILENPGVMLPSITIDIGLRYGREPYSHLFLDAYTLYVPPSADNRYVTYEGIIAPVYQGEWL
jgi:lipopolysaccharide transport system ATP-binding protein